MKKAESDKQNPTLIPTLIRHEYNTKRDKTKVLMLKPCFTVNLGLLTD